MTGDRPPESCGLAGFNLGAKQENILQCSLPESRTQSREAGEECCGSRCCKMSLVALSSRTPKGVRFQPYSSE